MRQKTTIAAGIRGAERAHERGADVNVLICRDHNELDRVLDTMLDPNTSPSECVGLLDALRIGFTAHAAAHGLVLQQLADENTTPALVRAMVGSVFEEHGDQARAIAALQDVRPGTGAWLARTLQLRIQMRDHSTRAESVRASLGEHVGAETSQRFVRQYATERLRRFGVIEPSRRAAVPQAWIFN